jgi:hypothetical protein
MTSSPRRRPPVRGIVQYDGQEFELNLAACRRAFLTGAIAGRWLTREDLARRIGRSRSTVSRFLTGRPTSLAVTLAIMGELGLRFEEVATRCGEGLPAERPDDRAIVSRPAEGPRTSGSERRSW